MALCIGVFILLLGLGAKRAASQSCVGVPGVGSLQTCTKPFFAAATLLIASGIVAPGKLTAGETAARGVLLSAAAAT